MSLVDLIQGSSNNATAGRNDRIFGVVTGIVEDIVDPQNLGRVKVNFPWLSESQDAVAMTEEKTEKRAHSAWARIATPMAGKKQGLWLIPELQDEVLVAFEQGDMDRPVVLGCLWNKDDQPPLKMDEEGKNDLRSFHTRSGHKLTFDDSKEKPSIEIVDNTGNNRIFIDSKENAIEISCAGDLTIHAGGKITMKSDAAIQIDAAQDINAEAKANLALKASSNGEFLANANLKLKASTGAQLDGGATADIKAAKVGVNGSGMTEIKGGLVKIN